MVHNSLPLEMHWRSPSTACHVWGTWRRSAASCGCVDSAALRRNGVLTATPHSTQDMHLLAERCILRCLLAAGLLRGELEAMLEARVGALFMPHGACNTVPCCWSGGCVCMEAMLEARPGVLC